MWQNSIMQRFLTAKAQDDARTVTTETPTQSTTVTPTQSTRGRDVSRGGYYQTNDGEIIRDETESEPESEPESEVFLQPRVPPPPLPGDSLSCPTPIGSQISAEVDDDTPWVSPEWHFVHGKAAAFNVSKDNIATMMKHIHKQLKPFITADLLTREPGEFASTDHTFRLAMRSMGDATAYVFFMGEDHTIFWHGAVESKSWEDLRLTLETCERRFKRMGVSGKLKYWWDDNCCSGKCKEKLDEHIVVFIFPGVLRCPFKDGVSPLELPHASPQSPLSCPLRRPLSRPPGSPPPELAPAPPPASPPPE